MLPWRSVYTILAWAGCVAYPCRWAMREPEFGISDSTDSHAFFVSCQIRGDYRRIEILRMNRLICSLLLLCIVAGCKDSNEIDVNIIPVKNGKYGYVDDKGNYLINPQFNGATSFHGGIALVYSGGLWGYIDTKGKFVINPVYSDATTFTEGIAWTVKKEGAPTAINRKGRVLFALKEAEQVYSFSEGLARYRIVSPYNEDRYLYGFVNKDGETVISPAYWDALDFSEGLAAVANENGEYGYINKKGELAINYQFDDASPFHEGRAIVSNGSAYGTIDKSGKYVINPQFGNMRQDEGNYIIRLQDGTQWGWCDAKGKIYINPQFDAVDGFKKNDLAPVMLDRKVGYIDRKGTIAINPQFDDASCFFDNNYAVVKLNKKWGAVDKDGKYIFNPQFEEIGLRSSRIATSDYFDKEAIMSAVQALVSQSKIDNALDFSTPLSRIMSEYGFSESSINRNKEYLDLKEISVSKDATITLAMNGEFYNKVSDGWWGYNYVLNKNAVPVKYRITISLKNKGEGKSEKVQEEVLNYFNPHARNVSRREYAIELDYGISHIQISDKRNKVVITCSKPS